MRNRKTHPTFISGVTSHREYHDDINFTHSFYFQVLSFGGNPVTLTYDDLDIANSARAILLQSENSFDVEAYDLFDAIVTAVQNASHSNSGPHHPQDPDSQEAV